MAREKIVFIMHFVFGRQKIVQERKQLFFACGLQYLLYLPNSLQVVWPLIFEELWSYNTFLKIWCNYTVGYIELVMVILHEQELYLGWACLVEAPYLHDFCIQYQHNNEAASSHMVSCCKFFLSFSLLIFYLDYVVLPKGIVLICFLVDGFRCSLMILETWQLLMMVLQYWRCYNFLMAFCIQRTTFKQPHFLEVLKDLFKYFGTLIMVIDNVMYLIIYFYVNIMLVWRHLWCYLVTFVVLS